MKIITWIKDNWIRILLTLAMIGIVALIGSGQMSVGKKGLLNDQIKFPNLYPPNSYYTEPRFSWLKTISPNEQAL